MCGTEVAHPDAFRGHRGDHFERRLEILWLAAARKDPRSEISWALAACLEFEAGGSILAKDLA